MTPPGLIRPPGPTRYRWVVCALIFSAITINYLDRLVFGLLAPELQKIFSWSNADYTRIVLWFEIAYAIGLAFAGRFLDRMGTRIGFALFLAAWCLAASLHAAMTTLAGFCLARFLLGLGESGAFPAAVKTTAEWFPRRERALVAGIFNSGSNVGAIIAPLAVPWLYLNYGWQWAFIATGAIGLVWLVLWLKWFRLPQEHPRVSAEELAHIQSDPTEPEGAVPSWGRLLRLPQTWSFIVAKFFTDAVWRWYLYLLPLFFSQSFGLDIRNFGVPFLIIYVMADIGSILGGWLSSRLIARGWTVNAARKTAMLLSVLCVQPVMFAAHTRNMWFAVVLVGLAAAAHQAWSSNIYTTISDMFPKNAVATIAGIGGTAGAVGAITLLELTRRLFVANAAQPAAHSTYAVLFAIAGLAYLAAFVSAHLLAPRLAPVPVSPGRPPA